MSQDKKDKETTIEFLRDFTDVEPIWIQIGDETGRTAGSVALSNRPGMVELGDGGAWVTVGVVDLGCAYEPDVEQVLEFQETEPLARTVIFKWYSKEEVRTLVGVTISAHAGDDCFCERFVDELTTHGTVRILRECLD
jgi:hypothetical protein